MAQNLLVGCRMLLNSYEMTTVTVTAKVARSSHIRHCLLRGLGEGNKAHRHSANKALISPHTGPYYPYGMH
jgi:hypothetical protein